MAKKNLEGLLDDIVARDKAIAAYRRSSVNRWTHIFTVNYSNLWQELYIQISGLRVKDKKGVKMILAKDPVLISDLKRLLTDYTTEIYTKGNSYKHPTIDVRVEGTLSNFNIIAEAPENNKIDVFETIIKNNIRKSALNKLQTEAYNTIKNSALFKELLSNAKDKGHVERTLEQRTIGREYERNVWRTIDGKRQKVPEKVRGSGIFEAGHEEGYSVAEKWLSDTMKNRDIAKTLSSLPSSMHKEVVALGTLRGRVLENSKNTKKVVFFYDQGSHSNKSQSTLERKYAEELANTISEVINSRSADYWANFESSPSRVKMVKDRLGRAAKKNGAKVPKDWILSSTSDKSSASKRITGSNTIIKKKDSIGKPKSSGIKDVSAPVEETPNKMKDWNKILPILNAKLPPKVIANMKYPALVNRTGTFANSAEIVGVEQTKEGYPSFVFKYERDPYDVFDRTIGRSPWNTPARDPRSLVDKSVRDLVKEMAIGRFFTRRTQW